MAIQILSALDTAKTQYYHFKAIIIAGMGMFTDAYDLFCIPPIMKLIGRVYYDEIVDHGDDYYSTTERRSYEVTPAVAGTMMGIALLGTAIGQLVFGRLGDSRGRHSVYGAALLLMVFSSFGCGFSVCTSRTCVLLSLGFFRFLLGLGIGGDYPLSATIMSEFSNKKTRGAFIAAVFSMQGFGILVSSTVTMVVCAVFNRASHFPAPPKVHSDHHTPESVDLAWRIILMIGAIPAALTFYWRISMPETPRYTALVEKNVLQATKDMQKVLDMSPMIMSSIPEEEETECFSRASSCSPSAPPPYNLCSKEFFRRHGRDLFACSISWFLVDIVFYSSNLFQSRIYEQFLLEKSTVNAYEEAFHVAKLQAILAVCSTIPGYFATVYFIDRIGRVKIQMLGFFSVAICLLAIGIPYYTYWNDDDGSGNNNVGFMVLYGLTFFFSNFGPNTTTFIVPAELFPARFRSTCHGISGAFGKIGSIIGSVGFFWASHDRKMNGYSKGIGMTASLMLLAAVSLLGMITTFLFTRETKGRSLEENENEDQSTDSASDFFVRGFTDCNFIRPKISIRNEDPATV